jgi:hypothetical protein|tara:strand:- start:50725 stop:51645 length:921 start_codon:yes stop_codon:yes gene_type:complete
MVSARLETFGNLWPLDTNAGFPAPEQLSAAGWFYDPAEDTPDGVTCAYCHLSLDAWDAGDEPLEEHRRRAPDCLFFALAELYHPQKPAPKKTKRATKSKRTSTRSSTASSAPTKKATRGKKRTSEAMDDTQTSESVQDTSKRLRYSSMSSFPDDLPVGTPKKTPTDLDTEPFTMSSLPASLLVGTPKRTPSHLKEGGEDDIAAGWQATDIEGFFSGQQEAHGFVNEIMIDAGLDELTMTGSSPEDMQAALLASLTEGEKEMTIEQWIMYNAKRGEEKLRMACKQQISAFQAEGKRALAMLEAIPTY